MEREKTREKMRERGRGGHSTWVISRKSLFQNMADDASILSRTSCVSTSKSFLYRSRLNIPPPLPSPPP